MSLLIFLKHFCENVTVPKEAYPDGLTVLAPIETWSDDFSIAISGIPSTVNDFSAGPFMETHYHSQYDNEEFYQEAVYRFHHELYTRLLVTLDQLTLPPLDFSRHFLAMKSSVADCLAAQSNAPAEVLEEIPALLIGLGIFTPHRHFHLQIDTQLVCHTERSGRRTPGVEAHMVHTIFF